MIVSIENKLYDMTKEVLDNALKTVEEKNSGSYFIYFLERQGLGMFVAENYDSKDEMRRHVADYAKKGFKVKYTVKEEK